MKNGKAILAIIPARGGSKGLPNKNILPMCGKPLIAWTLEQAKASSFLDTIIVSTDSEEIAAISMQYGIAVPFLRPAELAQDDSPTIDAVFHVINRLRDYGKVFDYIVLLEPTSPLRKRDDIDNAVGLIVDNPNADCLVSLGEVHMEHPMIIKRIQEDGFVTSYILDVRKIYQRQQADRAFFPYGVIYISKVSALFDNRTFYPTKTIPYLIERWQNYEVDDQIDFMIIEKLANLKLR